MSLVAMSYDALLFSIRSRIKIRGLDVSPASYGVSIRCKLVPDTNDHEQGIAGARHSATAEDDWLTVNWKRKAHCQPLPACKQGCSQPFQRQVVLRVSQLVPCIEGRRWVNIMLS